MRQFITPFLTTLLLAALTVSAPAAKKGPEKKDPGITGAITALDTEAKTLTIGGKTIVADSTTIVQRDGKASTFAELKMGEEANVTTVNLGGKLNAVTIKVGKPPVVAGTPAKKKK